MDDETLRREKYRCEFEGHDGITIGDLYFRAANPMYNRRVTLKKGEYILTELLDFTDLKKSRLSGALKSFIEMGWIAVENPATTIEKRHSAAVELAAPTIANAISELAAGTVKAKDITNLVATAAQPKNVLGFPDDIQPKVTEVVPLKQSRTVNSFAISEASEAPVDIYEKFNSLRYFQKLKTIKETADANLLEVIVSKSNYPQLVHNSKTRLRELQNGK
jgi:hypothetical protein